MKSKKFQLVIFLSIVLHASIFTALLYKSSNNSPKTEVQPPKTKVMQVSMIPPDMSLVNLEEKNEGSGHGSKICKGIKYTGVGLEWGAKDNSVSKILSSSPAAQAGVQIHDILLNQDDYLANDKPAGTAIEIKVMRQGILLSLPARVDYICRGL